MENGTKWDKAIAALAEQLFDRIVGARGKDLPYGGKAVAMEEILRERISPLLQLISQAQIAVSAAGHKPSCQFKACSCGTVEDFKVESGEFWRQVQREMQKWETK